MDTIDSAGMYETYGTCVDDECFDIHDYDDDTDQDTDDGTDDDTGDDTNDNDDADAETDDGGRGNLYTIKVIKGKVCLTKIGSRSEFVARTKNQGIL